MNRLHQFFEDGPKIMGILNVAPDSFSGDGLLDVQRALNQVERFIQEGVDIIDIGGESTRPSGAMPVPVDEELKRVLPVIEAVRQRFSVPLSIDTVKAQVAEEAVKRGVDLINDVSGLKGDPRMVDVVRLWNVPIVLTHSCYSPEKGQMDHSASGEDGCRPNVVDWVYKELQSTVESILMQGVSSKSLIVDPGIGFGKTALENLVLLKNIGVFKEMGYPILVGVSRKSFIGKITGAPVNQRLPGSLGAMTLALVGGVHVVRVHDVAQTRQIVDLIKAMKPL